MWHIFWHTFHINAHHIIWAYAIFVTIEGIFVADTYFAIVW